MSLNNVVVNLNRLAENIDKIREKTNKKIMAVVKSNAYGLNSKYLIPYLKRFKIDFFVFNETSEYLEVRHLCGNSRCLILNSTNQLIEDENIRYSINKMADLTFLIAQNKKITVHLQIDTGMNRLGIRSMSEYLLILRTIKKNRNIKLEGIFTHFSSNEEEMGYYECQQKRFLDFISLQEYSVIHSAASSSLKKNPLGNYVRVGLAMYGLINEDFLKEALYVKTYLINSFFVRKGDKIGYGQDEISKNDNIGVIPLGYYEMADVKYLFLPIKVNSKIKWQKIFLFGKSCMNHRFIHINFVDKKLSYLYLFLKNGTIYTDKYRFLISIRNIPKRYLEVKSDLSKIFKTTNKKGCRLKQRRNSDQIINFRIV